MKKLLSLATLMLVVFIATGAYASESKSFTMAGERIIVDEGLKIVDASSVDQPSQTKSDQESTNPSVAITQTDSDGRTVEVASGTFEEGKVVLQGTVNERTKLLVTVDGIGEELLTMNAVVDPGESISFVVLDYMSPYYDDRVLLVESSKLIQDSDTKFKVWGDLSSITDKDLSFAVAELEIRSNGSANGDVVLSSEQVLLRDGKFSFEGEVNEPLLFAVDVTTVEAGGGMSAHKYRGMADVVLEPGARIEVSPSKSSSGFYENFASELMANSELEGSMHSKVVESWQNSGSYLAKMDQYASAIEIEQEKAAAESSDEGVEAEMENADSSENEAVDPYDVYQEMEGIKNSVLSDFISNLDDPMAALLAMELGAPESHQLETWDKLIDVLDQDVAEARAVPRRKALATQIRLNKNAELIAEGHIAPEFTLANLEGKKVTLSEVLAESELVLVDFWASWCGPCIAQIPKLKEMHSEYEEQGFEIVFVSIDEEYDDWKGESDRQDLPWVNLGDLNGWHAPTAVDYGVQWVPTEFAIKTDGEILDRELTTDELEELLAGHFGRELKQEDSDESAGGSDTPATGSDNY